MVKKQSPEPQCRGWGLLCHLRVLLLCFSFKHSFLAALSVLGDNFYVQDPCVELWVTLMTVVDTDLGVLCAAKHSTKPSMGMDSPRKGVPVHSRVLGTRPALRSRPIQAIYVSVMY